MDMSTQRAIRLLAVCTHGFILIQLFALGLLQTVRGIFNVSIIKGNTFLMFFKYDNGPDAPKEGLFRIINKNGLMGFADTIGNLVIPPKYKFAYPFTNGKAKVTDVGTLWVDSQDIDRHKYWQSDQWYFISHKEK